MPPRVYGQIWSIRVSMNIDPIAEEPLFNIPNMVCVYHKGGARQGKFVEKPHYHLYYDAGSSVEMKHVQELIKSNEVIMKYYKPSNGFWSISTKSDYTLESYWEYVWQDYPMKHQRLIFWNIDTPQMSIPERPQDLVVAQGPLDAYRGTGIKTQIVHVRQAKAKTSLEKQILFYEYCKEYYENKPHKPITQNHVVYLLVKYCSNKGFTPESSLSTWARYAYFNLLEKPERKLARSELASKLTEKYF